MKSFFDIINLYSIGIDDVRDAVENENFDLAASEYRKYIAKRFSDFGIEKFSLGEWPLELAEQLMENKLALCGYEPVDLGSPIDWLQYAFGDKQWHSHLAYMYWLQPLITKYEMTGDSKYINKWCEIIESFIDNHPWGSKGLEYHISRPMYRSEYKFKCGGEGQTPGYLGGSWIGLAASSRTLHWINFLAHVIECEHVSDELILKIIKSLATDHCYVMLNNARRYTPNQFMSNASALLVFSIVFWDTKIAPACYLVGMQRLEEAIEQNVLPDGTDIEQSFNYNTSLPKEFYRVYSLYNGEGTPRIDALRDIIIRRCEYLADVTDYERRFQGLAKTHFLSAEKTLTELEKMYGIDLLGRPHKSVVFPYGGYYVSKVDGRYMFFKASRPAIGHSHEDCNAFVFTVDGFPMLIDCENYNYSEDDESAVINDYLFSTLAHNSVSVDGYSQIVFAYKYDNNNPSYLKTLRDKPIDKSYIISDELEVFDGGYDAYGYGISGDKSIPVSIDAKHNRKIIHITKYGIYVIVDTMESDDEHTYNVSWNFHWDYSENEVSAEQDYIVAEKEGRPTLVIKTFGEKPEGFEKFYGGVTKGRAAMEYFILVFFEV